MTTAEQLAKETAEKIADWFGNRAPLIQGISQPIILAALNTATIEARREIERLRGPWIEPIPDDFGKLKWELRQARILIMDLHDALHKHVDEIRALKGGKDG